VACRGRRFFEGLDIHPQRTIRTQGELLILKMKIAGSGGAAASQHGGFEGAASDVQSVVEVVEGGLLMEIGPEQLRYLLAVEVVARGEGEHLDEALLP